MSKSTHFRVVFGVLCATVVGLVAYRFGFTPSRQTALDIPAVIRTLPSPQLKDEPKAERTLDLDRTAPVHEPHVVRENPVGGAEIETDWLGVTGTAPREPGIGASKAVTDEAFSLARLPALPRVGDTVNVSFGSGIAELRGTVILANADDAHAALGVKVVHDGVSAVMHLDYDGGLNLVRGTILAPRGVSSYVIERPESSVITIDAVSRSAIVPDDDGSFPAIETAPTAALGGDAQFDPPAEGGGGAGFGELPCDSAVAFSRHSKAGANHVVYLDFDGHVTSGTSWNSSYGGGADITTPIYSVDGTPAFSTAELQNICDVWRRVAEDFIPFNVDVTTEDPGLERLRKSGTGDTQWGVRTVIGGNSSWLGQSAGGVAYIGSFSWNSDTPVFVFEDNLGNGHAKYVAEAVSHEVGHALSLGHDGTASVSYYSGHGSGEVGWASIMGVGYYQPVSQWSKGEYPGANNTQDDLAILTTNHGFGYRTDDHGNGAGTATSLGGSGGTREGIVERNTDVDVFRVDIPSSGTLDVTIGVDDGGRTNLDVKLELRNNSGAVVASSDPATQVRASLADSPVTAGSYYVHVSGTGAGSSNSSTPFLGYSNYASLGQFSVTVAFDNGGVAPTSTPTATPTSTPTFTPTFTPTSTATPTPTNTSVAQPTATHTPDATPTMTPSSTPTALPTATSQSTNTPAPTVTPTATPTATSTRTATPTNTPTPAGHVTYGDDDGRASVSNGQWEVGFTGVGWTTCNSRDVFGKDCRYGKQNSKAKPAEWCKPLGTGEYKIQATWLAWPLAPSQNKYSIFVGSTLALAPAPVDQRQSPIGILDKERVWQEVGRLQIGGASERVCVRLDLPTQAGRHAIADGVRFERLDPGLAPGVAPVAFDSVARFRRGRWTIVTLSAAGSEPRPMVFRYETDSPEVLVREVGASSSDSDRTEGKKRLAVMVPESVRIRPKITFSAGYDDTTLSNFGTVMLEVEDRRAARRRRP